MRSDVGSRIAQGEVVAADEFLRGDPRSQRPDLQSTIDVVAGLAVADKVPESVRDQLRISKSVFLSGFLVYELYTVSLLHGAIAVETALKELFFSRLSFPLTLARGKKAARESKRLAREDLSPESLFELLWDGWRVDTRADFNGSFATLIKWAAEENLLPVERLDAVREWRNATAHGGPIQVVTQGMALSGLASIVEIINHLFASWGSGTAL